VALAKLGAMSNARFRYGVDAPPVLAALGDISAAGLTVASTSFAKNRRARGTIALALGGIGSIAATGYTYTTLYGKHVVWEHELEAVGLQGTERVLDLGCGRGAVLIAMARRLIHGGSAVGADLWTLDQSGNSRDATLANAEAEGVADRVEAVDADMRDLPFEADQFDLVTASMAVHNIRDREGREQALREAHRVLKPGGRLLVADPFPMVKSYANTLRALDVVQISEQSLGWRFAYGGLSPGVILRASKPLRTAHPADSSRPKAVTSEEDAGRSRP
jgi:2-polyprenyl-3-methyl-5-hydroxy-6-metoxy-1,4-benzoquinol methylase